MGRHDHRHHGKRKCERRGGAENSRQPDAGEGRHDADQTGHTCEREAGRNGIVLKPLENDAREFHKLLSDS
jgi:hypothetical protein